ncbi:hypothetical protein BGZ97_004512, partial [Linnemannia gamsii]
MTQILCTLKDDMSLQLDRLCRDVALTAELFDTIVIWTRTSPSPSNKQEKTPDISNPSIKRQRAFIQVALSTVPTSKIQLFKLQDTTAFGETSVHKLMDVLETSPGKVLVITAMADRIFTTDGLSSLVLDWIKDYPLLPVNSLLPPLLLPETWFNYQTDQWRRTVVNHVQAAQSFCEAFQASMPAGVLLSVPMELQRTHLARGFSQDRVEGWKQYAAQYFGPLTELNIRYRNGRNSYECLCRDNTHSDHCVCP